MYNKLSRIKNRIRLAFSSIVFYNMNNLYSQVN